MDTTLRAASEHASKMIGGALPASKASFHLHTVSGINEVRLIVYQYVFALKDSERTAEGSSQERAQPSEMHLV